jgi:Fic family protein
LAAALFPTGRRGGNWRDDSIAPVLKVGIAHFWFVTLHPFEDGNGRIGSGRAIADMALARADDILDRFYSLSMSYY